PVRGRVSAALLHGAARRCEFARGAEGMQGAPRPTCGLDAARRLPRLPVRLADRARSGELPGPRPLSCTGGAPDRARDRRYLERTGGEALPDDPPIPSTLSRSPPF